MALTYLKEKGYKTINEIVIEQVRQESQVTMTLLKASIR